MNQQRRSGGEVRARLKRGGEKITYALDDVSFWLEDHKKPIFSAFVAGFLAITYFVSAATQHAIDADLSVLRTAATEDNIGIKGIASGIRDGKVLADIAIGNCVIHDATIFTTYHDGVLEIEGYSIPTSIADHKGDEELSVMIEDAAGIRPTLLESICS